MEKNEQAKNLWTLPKGFKAGGLSCGIKVSGKKDIGIIISEAPAQVFAAFTQNPFCAASVKFCRDVFNSGKKITHVLVNSGNANACTGKKGEEDVSTLETWVKNKFQGAQGVYIAQTGIIGKPLPMPKLYQGLESLARDEEELSPESFAECIMTTDTVPKVSFEELTFSEKKVFISGAAKGSGMICPNMATMLGFFMTDLALPAEYQVKFKRYVDLSFNSISVDGDTSTNDMALLLSNGASGLFYEDLSEKDQLRFDESLEEHCITLAKKIILDGEGATKFVEVQVKKASSESEALKLGRAISNSPLVKTALFGGDPNWGRVIASMGTDFLALDPSKVKVSFCGTSVFSDGCVQDFSEDDLDDAMKASSILLEIELNNGESNWTCWTCDLSYDYVRINAEYHT